MRFAMSAALIAAMLTAATNLLAGEPQWRPIALPGSAEARATQQQPLLHRPYRPGHVYGNSVRRMHYRGNPLPQPHDFGAAAGAMFGR